MRGSFDLNPTFNLNPVGMMPNGPNGPIQPTMNPLVPQINRPPNSQNPLDVNMIRASNLVNSNDQSQLLVMLPQYSFLKVSHGTGGVW